MDRSVEISFVIIAFNEEKTIRKSILSIQQQTGINKYEILVVNDGSKDGTAKIVNELENSDHNIILINHKKNLGRGAARENGLRNAVGEYVAYVDADIILPDNWLSTCMKQMDRYDAVGGIAIPDGDVGYVYTKFGLKPKVVRHTTKITGSNGLYKRRILEKIGLNVKLKNGEDVDLTWRLENSGYRIHSINNLISTHREEKTFITSLKWLYEQGIGANKLLAKYKEIRLPDVTFALYTISLMLAISSAKLLGLIIPISFSLLVTFIHMYTKFDLLGSNLFRSIIAVFVQTLMITAYFWGRLVSLHLLFRREV